MSDPGALWAWRNRAPAEIPGAQAAEARPVKKQCTTAPQPQPVSMPQPTPQHGTVGPQSACGTVAAVCSTVASSQLMRLQPGVSECAKRPRATSSSELLPLPRRAGEQDDPVAAKAGRLSLSPAPRPEPALRRRRLTGKQAAGHILPPRTSPTPSEPCTACIGVPPSEGSWADSGEGRTVAARPDPRGVGSGRHASVHNAWVPAAATVTNGGRREAPLLGSRAPRLPADASRPSSLARRTSHDVLPGQASP